MILSGRASIAPALVLSVSLLAAPALARADTGNDLRYDLRIDIPVAALGAAAWVTSEALKSRLGPETCYWCDAGPDGSDRLNALDAGMRRSLLWTDTGPADLASNVSGFALAPAAAFGLGLLAAAHDDRASQYPVDGLIVAEATAVAMDLNQLVKFAVGRERPFVHALSPEKKAYTAHPSDNNVSFYSGHTSFTFALAVSSGTVASLRGYRWAPWVWGGGLTLALGTAYLRIAADRHYFTDVATGALVSSAIGFAIPYFFHRSDSPSSGAMVSVSAAPLMNGGALTGTWVW